jgi:biotin carboxyl carrier protein
MKKLRITVEGRTFEVQVELVGETPAAAPPAGTAPAPVAMPVPTAHGTLAPAVVNVAPAPAPAPTGQSADDVLSPLAGKVAAVAVQVGESVEEGAQLLTLEAMKMNTYVFAPKAGRVTAVHVKPGDAVSEGQALVHIA